MLLEKMQLLQHPRAKQKYKVPQVGSADGRVPIISKFHCKADVVWNHSTISLL